MDWWLEPAIVVTSLALLALLVHAVRLDARDRKRKLVAPPAPVLVAPYVRSPQVTPPLGGGRQEMISGGVRTEFHSGPMLITLKADVYERQYNDSKAIALRDGVEVALGDIEGEEEL